jgi:uroporphyrinogen decarboxylase
MNLRENFLAVLHYQPYDRMPMIHFGFWDTLLITWAQEGHITIEQALNWVDGNEIDQEISHMLGFDGNWCQIFGDSGKGGLFPAFERRILEKLPDGHLKVMDEIGVIVLEKENTVSIPMEIDHLLVDRKSYEKHYKWRLQYSEERIDFEKLLSLYNRSLESPLGINCGSMFGDFRCWAGLTGTAYIYADDKDLFNEIITDTADLQYLVVKRILEEYDAFDFGHFWEDICFRNGPMISPNVFAEMVGPHYRRITSLLLEHDIDIVSVDCDGTIDALLPVWLENGVNTMFPIEVGTWNGNIKPWREKYGSDLRGIGGMNKNVFLDDYTAIDREIERLKPFVESGGFIPCPDHKIAQGAKWENVQYYSDKMRKVFG